MNSLRNRCAAWSLGCLVLAGCGGPEDAALTEHEPGAVGARPAALTPLSVVLWPVGDIPYGFDSGISSADRTRVRGRMADWNTATWGIIDFIECTPGSTCPSPYLRIRYNTAGESGMACSIGRVSNATMRMAANTSDDSTLRHELGHCLGLAHEHQRPDRDRWLDEGSYVYEDGTDANALPLLGNYDYDSVMHYASYTGNNGTSGTLRWRDALGNAFSRWQTAAISLHDRSRVLQYYARDYEPLWDFFKSLSPSPANGDSRPDPYLASGVEAVGTPGVVFAGGTTHVFARGSNNRMYWKTGLSPGAWVSLGCCAGSDPSAVETGAGQIDLVFIGAESGKLIRTRYSGGAWGGWGYVQDGAPSGGIRTTSGGYIGPAITSRQAGQMDLFVVRADGRLASIRFGSSWTGWSTHGSGYVLTARPAAVALSSTSVCLAAVGGTTLYEPSFTFSGTSVTSFSLGGAVTTTATGAAPAITRRSSSSAPYRVLVVNAAGLLRHRFSDSSTWRDIGGIPRPGSGISAVATGSFSADLVMNGTDQMGCVTNCLPSAPHPGQRIQPGGIWVRRFE